MIVSIASVRKALRTWARNKPPSVSAAAHHVDKNLALIEKEPNDTAPVLAVLQKNIAALEAAKRSHASDLCGERQ